MNLATATRLSPQASIPESRAMQMILSTAILLEVKAEKSLQAIGREFKELTPSSSRTEALKTGTTGIQQRRQYTVHTMQTFLTSGKNTTVHMKRLETTAHS